MISEASPSPTKRVSMRAPGSASSGNNGHANVNRSSVSLHASDAAKIQTNQMPQASAAPDVAGDVAEVAPPVPRSMALCVRCGFQWFTRVEHPVKCPNCRSKKWDIPRSEDKLLTRKPRGKSFTDKTAPEASAKAAALRIAKARGKAEAAPQTSPEESSEAAPES